MVKSPSELYGDFKVLKVGVVVQFRGDIVNLEEHYFWGSAWRGLLGWKLKELSCPFLDPPLCNLCSYNESCAYYLIMADRIPESNLGIYDLPRPYVIYPETMNENGLQTLSITLFGSGVEVFPLIISALEKGESCKIGKTKEGYEIRDIRPLIGMPNYEPITIKQYLSEYKMSLKNGILVRILTPLRLRKKGILLRMPDWPFLLECGLKRLETLAVTYESKESLGKSLWEEQKKGFATATMPVAENYKWVNLERYSSRHGKTHPMDGFVGQAFFSQIPKWQLEWLLVCSLLGLGKGAAMGFGKLVLLDPFQEETLNQI